MIFSIRVVEVLRRKFSNSDQTAFARYKELLKYPGSSQATYGNRARYSQSDQIFKQRSRTGLVSFNKRFKGVENSHFSTTDYCALQYSCREKMDAIFRTTRFRLWSIQMNEHSEVTPPSLVEHSPRTETLPEQKPATNAQVLGSNPP